MVARMAVAAAMAATVTVCGGECVLGC